MDTCKGEAVRSSKIAAKDKSQLIPVSQLILSLSFV